MSEHEVEVAAPPCPVLGEAVRRLAANHERESRESAGPVVTIGANAVKKTNIIPNKSLTVFITSYVWFGKIDSNDDARNFPI